MEAGRLEEPCAMCKREGGKEGRWDGSSVDGRAALRDVARTLGSLSCPIEALHLPGPGLPQCPCRTQLQVGSSPWEHGFDTCAVLDFRTQQLEFFFSAKMCTRCL